MDNKSQIEMSGPSITEAEEKIVLDALRNGWYGKEGKPIQYSAQTPHDTTVHTEYGAGVRQVDKNITITTPDGKSIKTTMDTLLSHPEMYAAVSKNMGAKKYNV